MAEQDVVVELPRDAAVVSVGTRLRLAREARGMSIESVGHAIKLAPRQVEAIESDDFDRLMSPTYVRGFIRNYASLIGLDAQVLLGSLDQQHVTATPQLVEQADVGVAMPMQSARRKWLLPLVAMSVPVLAALALYVWFEFWPATGVVTDLPATEAAMPPDPLPDAPVDGPPPAPDMLVVPSDPSAPPEADIAAAPVDQAPAILPGQKQLAFAFNTDSWIEIRGADESIILSELNRAGSTRTVVASPPVSLVIGNARSVTMTVDGQPYDLAPSIKVDVARLRLE